MIMRHHFAPLEKAALDIFVSSSSISCNSHVILISVTNISYNLSSQEAYVIYTHSFLYRDKNRVFSRIMMTDEYDRFDQIFTTSISAFGVIANALLLVAIKTRFGIHIV